MPWTDDELKKEFPTKIYPDKELVFLEGHYTRRLEMLKAEQKRRGEER